MLGKPRPVIHAASQFQPILRELGIDAETVFNHALIKPWRTLDDRENCILDATLNDGRHIRWHIKRYQPARGFTTPADDEVTGHRALVVEKIPVPALVGYGNLPDRRSFVIMADLEGYAAADKLIESGTPFDRILMPTADLAAELHRSNLHHRDLYLCHFFVKLDDSGVDVRLIDTARVKRLPGIFTRGRWIVKDLAQFWYSTTSLPVADEQRDRWLTHYAASRGIDITARLKRSIIRKSAWIARHDAKLKQSQPTRNVSIPGSAP